MKVDNMTHLIDERDREVQNIVQSINELAQVRGGQLRVLVAGCCPAHRFQAAVHAKCMKLHGQWAGDDNVQLIGTDMHPGLWCWSLLLFSRSSCR